MLQGIGTASTCLWHWRCCRQTPRLSSSTTSRGRCLQWSSPTTHVLRGAVVVWNNQPAGNNLAWWSSGHDGHRQEFWCSAEETIGSSEVAREVQQHLPEYNWDCLLALPIGGGGKGQKTLWVKCMGLPFCVRLVTRRASNIWFNS